MVDGNRDAVQAFVAGHPGGRISDVARELRISHSTATYHLAALVRSRRLVRQRVGRELRHYAAGARPSEADLSPLAGDPRKEALLRFLLDCPVDGMSVNKVARAAGLDFGVAKRTLAQLDGKGFVRLTRRDYRYAVRVEPARRRDIEQQLAAWRHSKPSNWGEG